MDLLKDAWVNRLTTSSGGLSSKFDSSNANLNPSSWRLTRAILKNGVLSLYKPPSDIIIRRFDPEMALADDISPVGISDASPSLTTKMEQVPQTLTYRGFDQHPALKMDESGQIVSATNEALCHTILFGSDQELAKNALIVLLVVSDVFNAFTTMRKYVDEFTASVRAGSPRLSPTSIVARVALVIDTTITSFQGMLLDSHIHSTLQEFAESIISLDDAATAGLKRAVYERQEHINNVVYQKQVEIDPFMTWQEGKDIKNKKIRSFLSNVENRPDFTGPSDTFSLLTPELFVEMMDSDLLCNQISHLHQTFYNNWSPAEDISLLFKIPRYSYYRFNPLLFESQDMHFLARLLMIHLFQSNLDAEYRAKVLERWINLGNSLKAMGDIVGWVAIATVICSVGVLRLRETWSYVSEQLAESVVKDWGFEVFEVEKRSKIDVLGKKTFRVSTEEMGEAYPKERAVPYFGDLFIGHFVDEEESEPTNFKLTCDRIKRITTVLNGWRYYFDQVAQDDTFGPPPQPNVAIQKLLYLMLREHALLPKITSDNILQNSLKVEAIISGTYLKSHYAQPLPLNTGAFLPLIFTDTNPSYKLFAKPALIAASGILKENKKHVKSRTPSDSSTGKLSLDATDSSTINDINHALTTGFSRHLRLNPFGSGRNTDISISSHSNRSNLSIHSTLHSSSSIGPGTYISSPMNSTSTLQRSNSFPPVTGSHPFALTTGYRDVDLSSQQFMSQYVGHNLFVKSIRDVLNVGARIFKVKDDIVLKAFDEDISSPSSIQQNGGNSQHSSRPSSFIETPSQRLSSHSSRRMSSQLASVSTRGSDMTAIAAAFEASQLDGHRSSLAPTIINVVVKAANFEKLVDILVLGVNEFSPLIDLSDIDSLQKGDSRIQSLNGYLKRPQFKIDMNIHTLTFFATFRSFSSCSDLVKSLRRRFSGAGSAALSIVEMDRLRQLQDADVNSRKATKMDNQGPYPNWDAEVTVDSDNSIAWRIVAQIQIGVLEACHLWVSRYFNDFMNNNQVRQEFLDLIQLFGQEIQRWRDISIGVINSKDAINEDYRTYLEPMESLYKKVRNLFVKKSYRPADPLKQIPLSSVGHQTESIVTDQASLEAWLDDVDTIANDLFAMMEVQDWLEVFEILEIQGIEPAGFFNYDSPTSSTEEDVVIQDIYSYIYGLRRDKSQEKVLKLMPYAIQELFKMHNNIVNYLVSQITDIYLSKDVRIARFTSVLKMLGICRSRMSYLRLFQEQNTSNFDVQRDGMAARVPAFVESAIVTALMRPESRLFANAWIQAGLNFSHKNTVTLPNQSELFVPIVPLMNNKYAKPMTTCVGWLLERMLEIVCYVPNMSVENSSLINFDKRRYIYNLVTNVSEMSGNIDEDGEFTTSRNSHYLHILREKLAHLVNPDQELHKIAKKAIREVAAKEAKQYTRNAMKNRVFTSFVQQEMDKIRRDRVSRDTIERQNSASKETTKKSHKLKGTSILSSGMSMHDQQSLALPFSNKQKSRFGGLLKAVRPLSMAFNSGSNERNGSGASTWENVVPVNVLPDVQTLNDVRCKIINNIDLSKAKGFSIVDEKSCIVKISIENAEYGIQTRSLEDADEWIRYLEAGRKYAKYKEWTSPDCKTVFGVPLEVVCEREQRHIPLVVETLLMEIEKRGMEELGLYRVSGSIASVNLLRNQFDSGANVNMADSRWYDINTVAGCLKLYLRELPDPILTEELSREFIECGSMPMTDIEDLGPLYMTIRRLPEVNFAVLKRLMQHLGAVAALEEKNRMKTPNLAVVFSMSLVPSNGIEHMRATQNLINTMILYHEVLFDDIQNSSELIPEEPGLDIELSSDSLDRYSDEIGDFYENPEPVKEESIAMEREDAYHITRKHSVRTPARSDSLRGASSKYRDNGAKRDSTPVLPDISFARGVPIHRKHVPSEEGIEKETTMMRMMGNTMGNTNTGNEEHGILDTAPNDASSTRNSRDSLTGVSAY